MSQEILTLTDAATGSTAQVLPGYGFNCYRWTARLEDREYEILWSAPGFESGTLRAAASGLPILFPFSGRIGGSRFTYEGREFVLPPPGDGKGNGIHGFVLNRAWRVLRREGDTVTGQFQPGQDAADLLPLWPADYELTATITLRKNTLRLDFTVRNPDRQPLPFWMGTHGYFRVPLSPQGTRDACLVKIPARQSWELQHLLPTGQRLCGALHRQVAAGITYGESQLDDIFTDLIWDAKGVATATIADPCGRQVTVRWNQAFSECVVFNPPHREALCIEPYSSVSDAFRLESAGVRTGMRALNPGETWTAWLEVAFT